MTDRIPPERLTELADGLLAGPEWDALLAANPESAADLELARRVRLLLDAMRAAEIQLPDGFESRLMARVREDKTLLDLIDIGIGGVARTLLELLAAIFSLLPQPAPQTRATPA